MIKLINWAISAWKANVSTSSPMFLSRSRLFFWNLVRGYSPLTGLHSPCSLFSLRVEPSGKEECSRRLRRHGRMWRSLTEEGKMLAGSGMTFPTEPVWPVCVWLCMGKAARRRRAKFNLMPPPPWATRGPHPLNIASSGKGWEVLNAPEWSKRIQN